MIVEAVRGETFLPPIMVAIGFMQIIALGDRNLLVAIDARVLVAIVDDRVAVALEHLAEFHDLLGEGTGGIFPDRDRVRNSENVKSVAHRPDLGTFKFPHRPYA